MAGPSSKVCIAVMPLVISLFTSSTSAQASSVLTASNVTPIRPEFTRPGGLPGASRTIAGEPELYLRAVPVEPPKPAVRKKRKRR